MIHASEWGEDRIIQIIPAPQNLYAKYEHEDETELCIHHDPVLCFALVETTVHKKGGCKESDTSVRAMTRFDATVPELDFVVEQPGLKGLVLASRPIEEFTTIPKEPKPPLSTCGGIDGIDKG